jgi:hypothetical protein
LQYSAFVGVLLNFIKTNGSGLAIGIMVFGGQASVLADGCIT